MTIKPEVLAAIASRDNGFLNDTQWQTIRAELLAMDAEIVRLRKMEEERWSVVATRNASAARPGRYGRPGEDGITSWPELSRLTAIAYLTMPDSCGVIRLIPMKDDKGDQHLVEPEDLIYAQLCHAFVRKRERTE